LWHNTVKLPRNMGEVRRNLGKMPRILINMQRNLIKLSRAQVPFWGLLVHAPGAAHRVPLSTNGTYFALGHIFFARGPSRCKPCGCSGKHAAGRPGCRPVST
jgi:hypothetical protein